MYKILRIIFCILSAICVIPTFFLFAWLDFGWGMLGVAAILLFFTLTVLFKNLQAKKDFKENPPQPTQGDFFHPLPKNTEISAEPDESSKD